jgi:hypothetical protein
MRVYLPISRTSLVALQTDGMLGGTHRACAVPAAWRAAEPQVDEEQWEFEAQSLAAEQLMASAGGVVLALDLSDPRTPGDDGWLTVTEAVRRSQVAAVLTRDLAWYGLQEIGDLLTEG